MPKSAPHTDAPEFDSTAHHAPPGRSSFQPGTKTSEGSARRHGRRAAGVAGAILATTIGATALAGIGLATPAQAASTPPVWNRVAKCESGNRWHIHTGNGYYGGLQFSASTWRAYHGRTYASRADRATRVEQIEVARRVLASQGPGAWPVCGPRAGLTRHSGKATRAALPAVAGHQSAKAKHKRKATHAKHGVAAKHASHKHASKKKAHHRSYTVRHGDTLSKIAKRLHVHGGWRALYRANRSHLSNPNLIRVGQKLTLP